MSRLARVVIPGIPYHVPHRGNRRADVFRTPADRQDHLCDMARGIGRAHLRHARRGPKPRFSYSPSPPDVPLDLFDPHPG